MEADALATVFTDDAVAATPPPVAKGSSADLCEVPREPAWDMVVPVSWLGSASEGYVGVLIAGVALGFVIAVLILALICCACPCARPGWCRGVKRPSEGETEESSVRELHHVPAASTCSPAVRARRPRSSVTDKRSVHTQSQVKYTWWYASPRFQPLADREHGAWVE